MKQIAQIIPYFGEWPEWIELYLYSCSRNKMIDFIFYTDCPVPKKTYENTHFITICFADYQKLVEERLGIEYSISNPFKLTDLRPFFGVVHEPELRGYEFWSFGDIDLCYGDLSDLLSDRNLRKYDLITTHNYHIAGHFTVLRNNDYWRSLCFKLPAWQLRLCGDKHHGFDEGEWSNLIYPSIKWPLRIYTHILSKINKKIFNPFMNFSNRLLNPKQHFIEYHTSPAPKNGQKWIYDVKESKIMSPKGIELPYLHFLFFKKTPWLDTEIFWQKGFYKISKPVEQLNYISISCYGISGE